MSRFLLALAALLTLAACSSLPDQTQDQRVTQFGGETVVTWPADQNHMYLKNHQGKKRICRSTPPDFALSTSAGGTLSVGGPKSESVGMQESQSDLALGGRSPAVLIIRELMYRSCELTLNVSASDEKAEEIYFKTLEVVRQVAGSQNGSGSAPVAAGGGSTFSLSGDDVESDDTDVADDIE